MRIVEVPHVIPALKRRYRTNMLHATTVEHYPLRKDQIAENRAWAIPNVTQDTIVKLYDITADDSEAGL